MNYAKKVETVAVNPNRVKREGASADSNRTSALNWKVDMVITDRVESPLISKNQKCSYTYN